jgi:ceramide glucosyltransferase
VSFHLILAILALLSLLLTVWQWSVARSFPLHQRGQASPFSPAVTLLKPLKDRDAMTESCLRSWFSQDYAGPVQLLFGVASADDPVCELVRRLQQEFSHCDSQLIVCGPSIGANAKISKLAELAISAKHEIFAISDADVRVPADFLSETMTALRDPTVGLVNCFYRLANPSNLAMRWEAVAVNADFWSQVLQAQTLKPLDFALGAVMVFRREQLEAIGGFKALANCLADDYQLGHRIAQAGHRIALTPLVAECWSAPMGWKAVWNHQLRWARTIRVCQPAPYFFSILSNATLWPLLWAAHSRVVWVVTCAAVALLLRTVAALDLQWRITQSRGHLSYFWLVPLKDLLQVAIWALAFAGNRIEWRGERMRLKADGTLVRDY